MCLKSATIDRKKLRCRQNYYYISQLALTHNVGIWCGMTFVPNESVWTNRLMSSCFVIILLRIETQRWTLYRLRANTANQKSNNDVWESRCETMTIPYIRTIFNNMIWHWHWISLLLLSIAGGCNGKIKFRESLRSRTPFIHNFDKTE